MYFSGKITYSVTQYLLKNGIDAEELQDIGDVPVELSRDPTCWLEAPKVEEFLQLIDSEFSQRFPSINIVEAAGHAAASLRAWGVLDSVLKMMQKPNEIYSQPQRIISYFISPAPPIANLNRSDKSVAFDLPMADSEYPYVSTYIRSALEALPTFMGRDMAQGTWTKTRVTINWSQTQSQLFSLEDRGQNMKPEFLQGLLANLEDTQKQLEEKKKELCLQKQETIQLLEENERLKMSHLAAVSETDEVRERQSEAVYSAVQGPLRSVQQQVHKLSDYVARAGQLVTLLVGQNRMNPEVREAMRRVDWEMIRSEAPKVLQETLSQIEAVKVAVKEPILRGDIEPRKEEDKVSTNLNALVEKVIADVGTQRKNQIKIDSLLFLDRPVSVFPKHMEQAIFEVLNQSMNTLADEGRVRIVTRPKGQRAEIEISDTGAGLKNSQVKKALGRADTIVKMHQGNLMVQSRIGEGSTFVIDLPM